MSSTADSTKEAIRAKALALGFDEAGFAAATPPDGAAQGLAAFIDAGYHGDMGWMARRSTQRAEPKRLWGDACSIIVLAINYGPHGDPLSLLGKRSHGVRILFGPNT